MSFSRDDFLKQIAAEVSNQPLVAQLFQAGDPRVIAHMNAMATMLAMHSQQIDVESMEPFTKTRDTTVLADATLKGILPFARPARVTMSVKNGSDVPLTITAGRRMIGPQSRVYVAETSTVIQPNVTGVVAAKQLTTRAFAHTVVNSTPFYSVVLPMSNDAELFISGVYVSVAGVQYPYTPEFSNLGPNVPGFALETDEYRNLNAKFGWAGTFGVQPPNGTVIDFLIEETGGVSELPSGATFTFETNTSAADQLAKLTLSAVAFAGANPADVTALRELTRYPSAYDSSAVYLGNFDYLVRRNIAPLRFLSVWNEKIEETVRPAALKNVNRLFIAAMMDGVTDDWLRNEITKVIMAADDSYRLEFVTPVSVELPVTVNAQVSVVHDPDDVASKIKGALLGLYGRDSAQASRGMLALNTKRMYDELRGKVPALQDTSSDFQLTVPSLGGLVVTGQYSNLAAAKVTATGTADQYSNLAAATAVTTGGVLPEHYRYLSEDSITVNVTQATYNDGLWSH